MSLIFREFGGQWHFFLGLSRSDTRQSFIRKSAFTPCFLTSSTAFLKIFILFHSFLSNLVNPVFLYFFRICWSKGVCVCACVFTSSCQELSAHPVLPVIHLGQGNPMTAFEANCIPTMWNCDITIYNNKYIFGFLPVPGTENPKPLKFPVIRAIRSFCYVNEATFGKPLGNLRMSAGCQGSQPSDQRVTTSSTSLPLQLPGMGAGAGGWYNHSYPMI